MKASACGLLALSLWAADVAAQQHDPAAAQALFDDAMTLMKAHNYAKACPKLLESQRLDPGIGTQFHLAECYEGQGLTASAWAQFLEVASLAGAAGQADRQQAAKKRAAKLEPRLGKIRITVPSPKRVAGLHVDRDGIAVQEVSWDSPLPADPGDHEISFSASGYRSASLKVSVREGQTTDAEAPKLESAPDTAATAPAAAAAPAVAPAPPVASASAPPPSAPAAVLPPTETAPPHAAAETPPSSGPGTGLIVLGTIGFVGLGAGAVLGLMANSKFQDSKDHCNPANIDRCDDTGIKTRDDSITLANASTIAFAAGAVGLGAATVILLTRDTSKSKGTSASLHAGPGSVVLRGSF
jgi:hypothetical protein